MAAKLTKCKVCGADMAASAKVCPQCGAKNKKPFYKKWWFWLIVVFVVIGSAGSSSDENDAPQEESSAAVSTQQETPAKTESKPAEKPAETESKPVEKPAESEPVEITYTQYDVTELFDALSKNALKAEQTFQDQYVEIKGFLSNIDSDGKYISVGAHPDDYTYLWQSIQCYIKGDTLLEQVLELEIGNPIVVRGKINDIGEVLGYTMNLDSIN